MEGIIKGQVSRCKTGMKQKERLSCYIVVQDLLRLRKLDLVFGHELSDEGVRGLRHLTQVESLGLIKFMRLRDDNLLNLQPLVNLKELTIQVWLRPHKEPRHASHGSCIAFFPP